MDTSKYTAMFLQEVRDNLAHLNQSVVQLEKDPSNLALLQEIMRLSHSSKSIAASVGFSSTSDLFHALEDIFDAARKGTFAVTDTMTSLCFQALDAIAQSLQSIEQSGKETDCTSAIQALHTAFHNAQEHPDEPTKALASEPSPDTDAPPDTTIAALEQGYEKINYIRVETEKVDRITNLAGELTLLQQQLRRSQEDHTQKQTFIEDLDRLTQELMYHALDMRLVPLEQAFASLPRLVRDLAKSQNKEVRFVMEGIDIDLDKTLVDHLLAPVTHMLRNAIDHGIEATDARNQSGKSAEGLIRLVIERDQGFVRVTVEDDGSTIDVTHLKSIAAQHGFSSEELEGITADNILHLLCSPRFSSKEEVSTLSGRGVGLSAVQQSAQSLGGQFTLTLTPTGKRFTLSLPLQLSIIHALLITVAGHRYALPLIHIRRLLSLTQEHMQTTLGEPAMVIDGTTIPLLILEELFAPHAKTLQTVLPTPSQKEAEPTHNRDRTVILIALENGIVGLVVDDVIGKADIMIKPVSNVIRAIDYFAGSTILSDGQVALMLDVPSLIRAEKHLLSSPLSR